MKHLKTLATCLTGGWLLAAAGTACSGSRGDSQDRAVAATAQALSVPLSANIAITSQWTAGYCASVTIANGSGRTISGWSAVIALNGSNVSSLWDAQGSVSAGTLTAAANGHNGVVQSGGTVSFGFCATRANPSALPTLVSATGETLDDPPAGLAASLSLTSNWDTGYCASVAVRNTSEQTLNTWKVIIDLNESALSSIWNASGSTSAGNLTALPLSYNAVLAPGGSRMFGFCANKTGPNFRPSIIFPGGDTVTRLTAAVYIPRRIATCFIGDPCAPPRLDCVGLRNDDNVLVESFVDATFEAVRTTDPRRATAAKEVCVEMVLTDQDRAEILAELDTFKSNVSTWSHADIDLELRLIDFDRLDMDESRFGGGVWIAPWNLAEFAIPRLDFAPDFNMVVPPIRDPMKELHHDLGGCGGTFGADIGIAGGGWSWIPKTKGSFFFDCAEQPVLTHEWLHQAHFAYQNLSGFQDLYGNSLPACRMGDPDTHRWFPDSHQCNEDPDYERCGLNDCGSNDLVNEHILGVHWDPALAFVANHCEDGLQDFGETGVDSGGPCLSGLSPSRPAAPSFVTPTP